MRDISEETLAELRKREGGAVLVELLRCTIVSSSFVPTADDLRFLHPVGRLYCVCLTDGGKPVVVPSAYPSNKPPLVYYPVPYQRDEVADTSGETGEMTTKLTVGDAGGVVGGLADRCRGMSGFPVTLEVGAVRKYDGAEDRRSMLVTYQSWTEDELMAVTGQLAPWNKDARSMCLDYLYSAYDGIASGGQDFPFTVNAHDPRGRGEYVISLEKRGSKYKLVAYGRYRRAYVYAGSLAIGETTLIGTGRGETYIAVDSTDSGIYVIVKRESGTFMAISKSQADSIGYPFDLADAREALAIPPVIPSDCLAGLDSIIPGLATRFDFVSGDRAIGYNFQVGASSYNGTAMTFDLKSNSALAWRFPYRTMLKGACPWIFKSVECGYKGADETCEHTITDCLSKNNIRRIGCFPGCGVGGLAK